VLHEQALADTLWVGPQRFSRSDPDRPFLGLVAPPALAPGLQQCCTNPPPRAFYRLSLPQRCWTDPPSWTSSGPAPQRFTGSEFSTARFMGSSLPRRVRPGLQRCCTDAPQRALFGLVAPPGLAQGLHHCSARAEPVSCSADCAVLRLFCFDALYWLVAPPALAPGLQRCCTDPPSRTLPGPAPTSSAAVNPTRRVFGVGRSPGACAGAPAVLHGCAPARTFWFGRSPRACPGAPPLQRTSRASEL
jgi:hypothetical protein